MRSGLAFCFNPFMNITKPILALLAALVVPFSASHGQIASTAVDFSSPLPWGYGSCQMRWDQSPSSIRSRGDDGMSKKCGDHFAVIDAGLWTPMGDVPYIRSLVSQTIWPVGTIGPKDVGKTVKFSALFGWQGGEPARVQDIFVARHTGFLVGDKGVAPLDGQQEFAFESVNEKDWGEVSSTYTIRPEDAGEELKIAVTVLSKQEMGEGLPVIATSDWKITVSD